MSLCVSEFVSLCMSVCLCVYLCVYVCTLLAECVCIHMHVCSGSGGAVFVYQVGWERITQHKRRGVCSSWTGYILWLLLHLEFPQRQNYCR